MITTAFLIPVALVVGGFVVTTQIDQNNAAKLEETRDLETRREVARDLAAAVTELVSGAQSLASGLLDAQPGATDDRNPALDRYYSDVLRGWRAASSDLDISFATRFDRAAQAATDWPRLHAAGSMYLYLAAFSDQLIADDPAAFAEAGHQACPDVPRAEGTVRKFASDCLEIFTRSASAGECASEAAADLSPLASIFREPTRLAL